MAGQALGLRERLLRRRILQVGLDDLEEPGEPGGGIVRPPLHEDDRASGGRRVRGPHERADLCGLPRQHRQHRCRRPRPPSTREEDAGVLRVV